MIETCHTFGAEHHLVGIATHAAGEAQPSGSPSSDWCLLMLNAGMLPSAGPFRLHVELAKAAAAQGVSSFRFDLSGIGESLAVGSAIDSTHRAVAETKLAMDFLQQEHRWNRFLLFGLCAGADDAMNVALADQRVRGAILLDGCGYRTTRYHARKCFYRQLPNLLRPQKLLRKAQQWIGGSAANENLPPAEEDIREFPDRITAQRQFQSLVDRDVALQMVYTGGVHDYFNHRHQFREMFPQLNDRGNIDVQFFPHWDHVLYLGDDRQHFLQLTSDWMRQLVRRSPSASELTGEPHQHPQSSQQPKSLA